MKRPLVVLGIVVALQATLAGIWLVVETRRAPAAPFRVESLDEPAPALAWEARDGPGELSSEPVLVHFWATWCAPCREELPALIAAAEAEGVRLVAVTDEPWPVIERFFDGSVPSVVVRDPVGDAARRWSVSGLPDTFAVRDRRVRARVGGPRDWSDSPARTWLRAGYAR